MTQEIDEMGTTETDTSPQAAAGPGGRPPGPGEPTTGTGEEVGEGASPDREIVPLRPEDLDSLRDVLLAAFERTRREDHFREDQVAHLHRELQEHRDDLLARVTRPLVLSLIRLHDDLGRCAEAWRQKPPEDLSPERLQEILGGFQDDVEVELEHFGIETFRHPGDRFDPTLQKVMRTEDAPRPELAGCVVEHLRPGYVCGPDLVRRERVAVYRAASVQDTAGSDPGDELATPKENP